MKPNKVEMKKAAKEKLEALIEQKESLLNHLLDSRYNYELVYTTHEEIHELEVKIEIAKANLKVIKRIKS